MQRIARCFGHRRQAWTFPPFAALFLLVVSLLVGSPRQGWGHGAFPATASLTNRKGMAAELLLGTTFGVLFSHDEGAHWDWICEEAMSGLQGVPPVLLYLPSGAVWAATFASLTYSTDGGCDWTSHPMFEGRNPSDVQVHPSDTSRLFVTTVRYDQQNGVYASQNGGMTFAPLVERANRYVTTIRLAPSNPSKMYAGTWFFDPYIATVLRSENGGTSWEETVLTANLMEGSSVHVIGVHPQQPDVVFVAIGKVDDEHLLRSEDGGKTFARVLSVPGRIAQLAASDDGSYIYLTTVTNLYRSTDGGKQFVMLAKPQSNGCIGLVGSRLYACASQFVDGFALGRSDDHGDSWHKVYDLADVRGPIACAPGTRGHDVCGPIWPQLQAQLDPGALNPMDGGVGINLDALIPDPDLQGASPPSGGSCAASGGGGRAVGADRDGPIGKGAVAVVGIALLLLRRRFWRNRGVARS